MTDLFADSALLPDGWAKDVRLTIGVSGDIQSVKVGADSSGAQRIRGAVLPGMPNLHSHAFQRAMAGQAEVRGPNADDDFWSWRKVMYDVACGGLDPAGIEAIAAQLYLEMVKSGYTHIAEFHYIHHDQDGNRYADPFELSRRVIAAARAVGIGYTHLPVLYSAGGFGPKPLEPHQKRFANDADYVLDCTRTLGKEHAGDGNLAFGIAPHSLRAASPDQLRIAVDGLTALDPKAPIHIHIAEQTSEVDGCLAWSNQRPVQWLYNNYAVDQRWCLIHATHVTPEEVSSMAKSGAVVGLCPTTEANLGDGIFPMVDYFAAGGRWGVGSDSHVSISPVEELRWLEYGQRLVLRKRNLLATAEAAHVGANLWKGALAGGAQSSGRPIGKLATGHRADLITLDTDHPSLTGRSGDTLLDAFLFCGNTTPVRDVMVGGRWVVRDGHHEAEEAITRRYRDTLRQLAA
ncbi:MAG: formimidoylglutamate deiminase [Alphaproteobacteria bacterium]